MARAVISTRLWESLLSHSCLSLTLVDVRLEPQLEAAQGRTRLVCKLGEVLGRKVGAHVDHEHVDVGN